MQAAYEIDDLLRRHFREASLEPIEEDPGSESESNSGDRSIGRNTYDEFALQEAERHERQSSPRAKASSTPGRYGGSRRDMAKTANESKQSSDTNSNKSENNETEVFEELLKKEGLYDEFMKNHDNFTNKLYGDIKPEELSELDAQINSIPDEELTKMFEEAKEEAFASNDKVNEK